MENLTQFIDPAPESLIARFWGNAQPASVPPAILVTWQSRNDLSDWVYLCSGSAWWAKEKLERVSARREECLRYAAGLIESLAGSWNAYHNSNLWC